jgi:hypothetical protein
MPLEGHWNRVNTPLRRITGRERRVLAAVAAVLAATVLGLAAAALFGRSESEPGCVDITLPSTMGAGVQHACGSRAQSLCASAPVRGGQFERAARGPCERAGYRLGRAEPKGGP